MKKQYPGESLWVQIVKTILLSASALAYTWPLVTDAGHVVIIFAVVIASVLASLCFKWRIRAVWCVLAALLLMAVGLFGCFMTLDVIGLISLQGTISASRFWYFNGLVLGTVFLTRTLALRWRWAQLIEASLVIGTVVYLFFGHRDFNLQNPRDFADYLYLNGYEPIDVYRWIGIGVAFLALPMLFKKVGAGRAVYSITILTLIALLAAFLIKDTRLPLNVQDPLGLMDSEEDDESGSDEDEDNPDEDDSDDEDNEAKSSGGKSDKKKSNKNNKNKNKSSSNNNKPQPAAIAVFYDEYDPADGIFHFRQTVLSEFDGNRLVASNFDSDVISTFATTEALHAEPVQNLDMHAKVSTSMFLIEDYVQPLQVAMGQTVFPIQNPDPKTFNAAYGVESLGFTMDLTRLIGRKSLPVEWSSEKVDHYLQIPDDPRYKALSDIIVRQIDPRFIEDDIVKAIYIKRWLEKNVYYTMNTKYVDKDDPTASFLFGSMRGHCTDIAHSATYLLRSQGIAARVAIGYAVEDNLRGTGSAVLIQTNQAHAWPEIHVDGVGWVTFEIFPEQGDIPPREFVDESLEVLFGELARNDKSGGKAEAPTSTTFTMPWKTIWLSLCALILAALLALYLRKIVVIIRAKSASNPDEIYLILRAVMMMWAMYGHPWRAFDTMETFARETVGTQSATAQIIDLAVARKMGAKLDASDLQKAQEALPKAWKEAAQKAPVWRKCLGWLNPWVRI